MHGVECRGETVPDLLFAYDTCLVASDASGIMWCGVQNGE